MTSKDLKLMAGKMVLNSVYSESAKKQLFNFIATESNDTQIKSLVVDGKIANIAEDAKQIVNERFNNMVEVGMIEILENTLTFMKIARDTICEYLETLGHPEEAVIEMQNFVLKEATDYQVMSMLMEKGLPDEQENLEEEYNLFESFNQTAGTNFIPLSEFEVSSSQLTILVEADTPKIIALKKQVNKNVNMMNRWAKTKGPKADARKAQIKQNLSTLKGEIGKERSKMADAGAAAVGGAAKGIDLARRGLQRGRHPLKKVASLLKQKAIAAKSRLSPRLSQMAAKLPSAAAIASKAKAFATSGAGMALGGTALATLLAYGASKIYKNYFSRAAKACAGQADKSGCMAKYKVGAIKAQISDLAKSASACAKSKNPEKCKASIQNKINKLKSKLA